MIAIFQAASDSDVDNARLLFREYQEWLGLSLCFQNFEEEVAGLPGRYAPPEGRLLLAAVDGEVAGCVALRKLEDGVCEMKRLYVRTAARGSGLGVKLIDAILGSARSIGYARMRLDTLPSKMGKAVDLYRSYGFVPIPAYYPNPVPGSIYLEKDLAEVHIPWPKLP